MRERAKIINFNRDYLLSNNSNLIKQEVNDRQRYSQSRNVFVNRFFHLCLKSYQKMLIQMVTKYILLSVSLNWKKNKISNVKEKIINNS